MVKHIVMWKLAHEAAGATKNQNALLIKEKLEDLNDKIPGLLSLEVGIDFNQSEQAYDLVLFSVHKDKAALDIYQNHPEHIAVLPFVKERVTARVVVDCEI